MIGSHYSIQLQAYTQILTAGLRNLVVVYSHPMFSTHFTFTKRQIGWLLLSGGLLTFIAIISIDILNVGREGGIGPAQQVALGLSALITFIGLTLIPLGDYPA
jgi:hypothetical protein